MAYPTGTGVTQADKFIGELWSDEVVAVYKANLVLADLVTVMPMVGKKGDTLHIPKPIRGAASAKVAATIVTVISDTPTEVTVVINKHYEYTRLIEDIVDVQALPSLRKFYTDDGGYALAKQVDTDLFALASGFNGGAGTATYDKAYIGGDGTTLYTSGTPNQSALTDSAIRRTIQRLDDSDVPNQDRFFVIPPVAANTVRGIARFTEQAFVGNGDTIRSGQIANLYGVPVFTSSNSPTATGAARICLLGHRSAAVLAVQENVRSQAQYKQEYLANLLTFDTIYGINELRDDGAYALAV